MRNILFRTTVVGAVLASALLFSGRDAQSQGKDPLAGVQKVYGSIPADQIEFLSSGDRIKAVAASGSMTAIWETLEHGERVECLDCIPAVEPLLYDANPRTREIAAWWLRRRMFGVFGPGEVYEKTIGVLKSDPNPARRAYAANALGEFLSAPGIDACAEAVQKDADPGVRAAAASALGRLNDDGKGAIAKALTDGDARVKLAALGSATRINGFTDAPAVATLLGDRDPSVRRRSAEALGTLRAKDAATGLVALAKNDPDANVRSAACHTLGILGDPQARPALEELSKNDKDGFVRDMAQIALRRL